MSKVPVISTYNHPKFRVTDNGTGIFLTGRANPFRKLLLAGYKYCAKCKKEKEIGLFTKNKDKRDGLQSYCRECTNAIQRK